MLADNPPAVAATSTPSDTAFLQAIYFLLLLQNKSAEGAYYYVTDHLGSPQIITDDSGSVVWKAEYLPFGKVNVSVSQIENNLRFPGQYYDAETGLHYNWNRYYDPETGRYIAADPIGLDGGMNLYAYVGSDPVNWYDFEGLSTVDAYCKRYPTSCGKLIKDGTLPAPIPFARPKDKTKDDATQESKSIPKPKKPKCGCTCICRADADGNMPGNIISGAPLFAFGTATAHNCSQASKEAKREAIHSLGMKPKHVGCRCEGK
ncbi:MAG: RHS repeat-associated core domain-containing protein [Candidatus Electrothrix sp. GW3-4]|uniref:RHS repeat domain-containing protein n=1 Tax=Candidatus Electrothrix sp. GW3-4 TaxID=3126740 RepID=UPI0030D00C6D